MRLRFNKNGQYSKAGEFVYDRPFLWGSKRTGPDLHREGGKTQVLGIINICITLGPHPQVLLCLDIHG
jgi:hypothetical protein